METTNTVTPVTSTTSTSTTTVVVKTDSYNNIVNNKMKTSLGRTPFAINEILDKKFSIMDLEQLNPTVKSPTIRAFVARKVRLGKYIVDSTFKRGGRGKPANIYRIV